MTRGPFFIALLAFVAAATWALTKGTASAWGATLIFFTVAVFLSPWIPGAGDNRDTSGDGGAGV